MLAIHKKILQLAGQPFDHSPIRFCARNGEYVTMDTSWAGFVHPWSRKVAFVLGRHKVRTAPLNEDVFTPPAPSPALSLDSDIQELSEQIHRLLLQPVHSPSPTGLCGVGAVASPGPLLSPGSSSDSNGGDAEGPGPPAPVSVRLPLRPLGRHSPGAVRISLGRCLFLLLPLSLCPARLPAGHLSLLCALGL